MQTRIGRNGRKQVFVAVWVDERVYDALKGVAKERSTTIAEVMRAHLDHLSEAEKNRPDAEQIIRSLLSLTETEREALRQHVGASEKKGMSSQQNKQRYLARLKEHNAKNTPPPAACTPSTKPKFP